MIYHMRDHHNPVSTELFGYYDYLGTNHKDIQGLRVKEELCFVLSRTVLTRENTQLMPPLTRKPCNSHWAIRPYLGKLAMRQII